MALLVFLLRQNVEVTGWTSTVGLDLLFSRLPLVAELSQVSGDSENWSGGDTKIGPPRGASQA